MSSIEDKRDHLAIRGLLRPLSDICRGLKVDLFDVLTERRSRQLVTARRACCVYLRILGMSYVEVGFVMNRSASAVMSITKSSFSSEPTQHGTKTTKA